jgi:methyltransferase (TIGR00027 family)
MRQDRPSETALRIAVTKVAASRDPVLRPLVTDPEEPYSEWFVRAHSPGARLRLALWKWGPAWRLVHRFTEAHLPGGVLHVLLRKRYIEEAARAALREGAGQVMVFGAGLDPLSVRLHAEFPSARFIEIDHPATQAVKRRALEERKAHPAGVTLHPVDLGQDGWPDRLTAAPGFQPRVPSLFLAEGLLMYLAPEAVDALFGWVRRNGSPGSRFVLTLLDSAVLSNPDSPLACSARILERVGEPYRFSLGRKNLESFFQKRRFKLLTVADHRTLRSTYLEPLSIKRPLMEGELIVVAEAV